MDFPPLYMELSSCHFYFLRKSLLVQVMKDTIIAVFSEKNWFLERSVSPFGVVKLL